MASSGTSWYVCLLGSCQRGTDTVNVQAPMNTTPGSQKKGTRASHVPRPLVKWREGYAHSVIRKERRQGRLHILARLRELLREEVVLVAAFGRGLCHVQGCATRAHPSTWRRDYNTHPWSVIFTTQEPRKRIDHAVRDGPCTCTPRAAANMACEV